MDDAQDADDVRDTAEAEARDAVPAPHHDARGNDEAGASPFLDDLALSFALWGAVPALPVVTAALALLELLLGFLRAAGVVPTGVLLLPALALWWSHLGWLGTQRIGYLRALRGEILIAAEEFAFTSRFVPRYLTLWSIGAIALSPLVIVGSRLVGSQPARVLLVLFLATCAGMALTFVAPALAYTSPSVRSALRTGLGMLRTDLPGCAPYVLASGFEGAVVAVLFCLFHVGAWSPILAYVPAALLALWLRGATCIYYLRRHEVGDNGAAWET